MERYWKATLENGETASEFNGDKWDDIVYKVKSLELVTENGSIKLPEGMQYIQAKTCSADLFSGKYEIESRYIGFTKGDFKFLIRINENTNDITVETNA